METNEEIKSRVYTSKEAVVVPLKVLANEGYMTFNDLDENKHSVLMTLGSTDPNSKCIDSTVVGTWEKENDTVIYLCTEISDELKNLPTKVEDLSDKIDDLENSVITMNSSITAIDNSISSINSYKADKSEINELKEKIQKLESDIALMASGGNNWKTCDSSHLNNCNGETLKTVQYIPVITLTSSSNPILLNNLSDYPSSYRNKYTTCTDSSQLGTKNCPRIIKFSDGTLSNG